MKYFAFLWRAGTVRILNVRLLLVPKLIKLRAFGKSPLTITVTLWLALSWLQVRFSFKSVAGCLTSHNFSDLLKVKEMRLLLLFFAFVCALCGAVHIPHEEHYHPGRGHDKYPSRYQPGYIPEAKPIHGPGIPYPRHVPAKKVHHVPVKRVYYPAAKVVPHHYDRVHDDIHGPGFDERYRLSGGRG